ncbi:MAG TPA: PQQ-binding-like beta-propeller repeat protein [Blastocatellia bacterium]|nr:PQQ-binding-like beta-propeller repeat protein [Blastocatellia bacterium]
MNWTKTLILLALVVTTASAQNGSSLHWPQWRGPDFNGMARGDAPTKWSDTENIKWKAAIPGRGFSTPVVWGDRIFVTTAVPTGKTGNVSGEARHPNGGAGANQEHQFLVMCLDKKTGKTVWQKIAKTTIPHEGYHRMYGSFASNAPTTDGQYLYVFFGSRGVFCYDLDGKLIWEKDLGVKLQMRNEFGEGTAAVVHGDTLILNCDQETDSFIVALDKRSGKQLWRTRRDEISTWAAPLVVEHAGRKQVITNGTNKIRSYDLQSGKLIWECGGLGLNAIPAPVHHDGIVYAMTGHRDPKLLAIKLGKEGDLTGTDAIVWSETRGLSYTPSPVLFEGKFYALTDNGMLSCFDAKTGTPYYHRVRLPKPYNFKASPVGANGKLYLATEEGDVVVVKMGEKFEVLATNTLTDQVFIASPVILDGEIFLRGQNTLFCVSEKK